MNHIFFKTAAAGRQTSAARQSAVSRSRRISDRVFRILWIFVAGGVLGFLIETVWCYFAFGGFSSRSSNLFFPFSIVWAAGAVLVTLLFERRPALSAPQLFLGGCFFCGVFEFLCGFLGEKVLGMSFWDYSALPLHIGRYVNVGICVLWGLICIVWIRLICPALDNLIRRLTSVRAGRILSVIMICFMICSNLFSGAALHRMNARNHDVPAGSGVDVLLDACFPDQRIQACFPKMTLLE